MLTSASWHMCGRTFECCPSRWRCTLPARPPRWRAVLCFAAWASERTAVRCECGWVTLPLCLSCWIELVAASGGGLSLHLRQGLMAKFNCSSCDMPVFASETDIPSSEKNAETIEKSPSIACRVSSCLCQSSGLCRLHVITVPPDVEDMGPSTCTSMGIKQNAEPQRDLWRMLSSEGH